MEPLEGPVRLVPTKLVRMLLNARACGERVHMDVAFMVVIFAVAAKECLVASRLESVVFRSVVSFITFCIKGNDGNRQRTLDQYQRLGIKLYMYFAHGHGRVVYIWQCVGFEGGLTPRWHMY